MIRYRLVLILVEINKTRVRLLGERVEVFCLTKCKQKESIYLSCLISLHLNLIT